MFGFSKKQRSVLHLTWVAFFLTFVAWFNMAPFNTTIMRATGLSRDQINILMICNVALTIPARIVIGSFVDRYGPRKVFSGLLLFAAMVSFHFASCREFEEFLLSRLMMGIVGAGFVVGITMVAEWFPPEKMGIAQGLYAGWGNFGAAAAAFALPPIAVLFPEETGWRAATAFSGALCLIWAAVYFKFSEEIPSRRALIKFSLLNSVEVTSRKDLGLLLLLMIPVYGAVLTVVWKLAGHPLFLLTPALYGILAAVIVGLFILSVRKCFQVNLPRLAGPIAKENQYEFRQIFILSLVYALTFGSELAVISMFPEFLDETFGLTLITAGALGSSLAFMNLVTRPSGGWLSDLMGRRRTLFVLVFGTMIAYWILGQVSAQWPLGWVIAVAILCAIFRQAGSGACFAMAPLIHRDLTGKFAGIIGSYGNVGAVLFLTVLSFVSEQTFFKIIGAYALVVLLSLFFLKSFQNLHASYNGPNTQNR